MCLYLVLSASEHRAWLLFYSVPVFRSVLPQPYWRHYYLLVASVNILHGSSITEEDLRIAGEYLKQFYKEFTNLYGETEKQNNAYKDTSNYILV